MNNVKYKLVILAALPLLAACTEEDCPNGVTQDDQGNYVCKSGGTTKPKDDSGTTDPLPPGSPAPNNPPSADFDLFREVAEPVGASVDNYYSRYKQLLVRRSQNGARVDSCISSLTSEDTFADSIAYAVNLGMQPFASQLTYVSSYYNLPTDPNALAATSLWQHPQCSVTASSLQQTLKGRNIPSSATITKLNNFARRVNQLREAALQNDKASLLSLQKLFTRMMMCLSYVESLTTADSSSSYKVAASLGVKKAEGVEYYLDGLQSDPNSELNIGLFQFSPVANGNVQACLRAWNARVSGCTLRTNAAKNEMIDYLGSARQTFNAFCGVTKVVDMFSVQVNTRSPASTHPDNAVGGALKAPANRCVSPFFNVSTSYNHFGPFQNTVNNNLDTLITCTLAE